MSRPPSNPMDAGGGSEPDDLTLVKRCQDGDMDAYEVLVNRYRQRVYNVLYGIVHNADGAEELCQETFVRAWRSLRRFKGKSAFYTWVYRIAANLGIDHRRRQTRHGTVAFDEAIKGEDNPVAESLASKEASPSKDAERADLRAAIEAAIARLSPEHRAVIVLKEYEGLAYKEIARVVGCSVGTVMSRLHYARKNLRRMLKDMR